MHKINMQVASQGQSQESQLRQYKDVIRDLWHMKNLINARIENDELRQEVLKIVSGYPEGSLTYAWSNIDNIIQKAQTGINKRKSLLAENITTLSEQPKTPLSKQPDAPKPKPQSPPITRKPLIDMGEVEQDSKYADPVTTENFDFEKFKNENLKDQTKRAQLAYHLGKMAEKKQLRNDD